MDEPFNAAYYSAAAQVIPVIFIVMLAREYWSPTRGPAVGVINIAVVGFVVLGEIAALDALSSREDPTRYGKSAIIGGFVFPTIRVTLVLLADAIRDVAPILPDWANKAALGWATALGSAVLVVAGLFTDPTNVLVAVFTLICFVLFAIGSVLAWPSAKRTSAPKDDD